jgi:hypothetical protein
MQAAYLPWPKEEVGMDWSYPVDCITPVQRTEYVYRCQELLRLVHNVMGTWYRDGITQNVWNKLPTKIQNRYPYAPKLTSTQWKGFKDLFENIMGRVATEICAQRELLKSSTTWVVDIGNLM